MSLQSRDAPTGPADGLPNPRRFLAFLAIATALTMSVLDSSVVNVALPVIARELAIDPATAIWAVNAYQIAVTISLLPLAALGDSLGYRRVYCAGLALFTVASLVCAFSPSFPVLIAARVLQGFGAAGIMSVTSVCSFAAQTLAYVSLPFYFHDVLGRSVTETGFLMTPFPLAVAVAAPLSGRLADRHSPGMLGGVGLALLATGLALLAVLPPAPSTVDLVWRLALCGFGFGLFQSPNNKMILSSAPRERSGGAGGMLSTARLLGQSIGAALVAALFGLVPESPTSAILWLGAVLSAIGCLASTLRMRGNYKPQQR